MPSLYRWLEFGAAVISGMVLYEAGSAIIVRDTSTWNHPPSTPVIFTSYPPQESEMESVPQYLKTSLYSASNAGKGNVCVDEPPFGDLSSFIDISRKTKSLRGKPKATIEKSVQSAANSHGTSPSWLHLSSWVLADPELVLVLACVLTAFIAVSYLFLAITKIWQPPARRLKTTRQSFVDNLAAQVGLGPVNGLQETVIFTHLYTKLQQATNIATKAEQERSSLQTRIADLQEHLSSMETRIRECDREFASLRNQSAQSQPSSLQEQRRIEALEQQNLDATKINRQALERIVDLEATSDNLKQETARLRSERDNSRRNEATLRAQLTEVQHLRTSESSSAEDNAEHLLAQIAEFRSENKEIHRRLEAATKDKESLKASLDQITSQMTAEKAALTKRLEAATDEASAMQLEGQRVRDELDTVQQEKDNLRQSYNDISASLGRSESTRKSIQSDLKSQDNALSLLQTQLSKVQEDLRAANANNNELQLEVATVNAKNAALQAEAGNIYKQSESAENIKTLQAEKQAATHEAASLKGEKTALLEDIKSLHAKITTSEEGRTASETSKARLAEIAKQLEAERAALLKKLEHSNSSFKEREAALVKESDSLRSTLQAQAESAASDKSSFEQRLSDLENQVRQGKEDLVSAKNTEDELEKEARSLRKKLAAQASTAPASGSGKSQLPPWLSMADVEQHRLEDEIANSRERNKGLVEQILELKMELAAVAKERAALVATARPPEPAQSSDRMTGVAFSTAADNDNEMDLYPGDMLDDDKLASQQSARQAAPVISQTRSVEQSMTDVPVSASPTAPGAVEQATAPEASMTEAPEVERAGAGRASFTLPTMTNPTVAASSYESSFIASMEDTDNKADSAPARKAADVFSRPRSSSQRSEVSADSGDVTIQVDPSQPVMSRRQSSGLGLSSSKYATASYEPLSTGPRLPSRSQPARKIARPISRRSGQA